MKDEQNNLNKNRLGLLSKLRTLLKPSKIVKSIAGLTIATGIAFSAFACKGPNYNSSSNNSNYPTSGEQNSDNSNASKYSQLLQNILKSNYYNNLISQAEKNNSLYSSAKFDPHPYAFLEDEGFDIEAIENGDILDLGNWCSMIFC